MARKPFAFQNLYSVFKAAVKKHPKNLHTLRFNTRLHHSKNKVSASNNFLKRAAKFSRILLEHPLTKIKKRKLSIDLAKNFGTLTSKNCMLYLELLYSGRKPKAIAGPGSLWGPGATVGTNVIEGLRISTVGKDAPRVGDIIDGFEASFKHCNRMRKAFSAVDFDTYEGLDAADLAALNAARDTLAKSSDVVCQHVYCEVGKVAQVLVLKRGKGRKFRRDATRPYVEDSDDDMEDTDDHSDADDEDNLEVLADDAGEESDVDSIDEALEEDGDA
jgi:hypothetical protein